MIWIKDWAGVSMQRVEEVLADGQRIMRGFQITAPGMSQPLQVFEESVANQAFYDAAIASIREGLTGS